MPPRTHDDPIDDFLKGYAAPVSDDGFTALIMAKADAKVADAARLRRRIINSAFFVGGLIAAVQVPKLWDLARGMTLPRVSIPDVAIPDMSRLDAAAISANSAYMIVGGAMLGAFMLWAIMADQLG